MVLREVAKHWRLASAAFIAMRAIETPYIVVFIVAHLVCECPVPFGEVFVCVVGWICS